VGAGKGAARSRASGARGAHTPDAYRGAHQQLRKGMQPRQQQRTPHTPASPNRARNPPASPDRVEAGRGALNAEPEMPRGSADPPAKARRLRAGDGWPPVPPPPPPLLLATVALHRDVESRESSDQVRIREGSGGNLAEGRGRADTPFSSGREVPAAVLRLPPCPCTPRPTPLTSAQLLHLNPTPPSSHARSLLLNADACTKQHVHLRRGSSEPSGVYCPLRANCSSMASGRRSWRVMMPTTSWALCVCVRVCACVCGRAHMRMSVRVCTHVCARARTCVYACVCVCVHVCAHADKCVYACVCEYVCARARASVRMRVRGA